MALFLGTDKVARVQVKQLIAHLDRQGALDDEEGSVLLMMQVQGDPCRDVIVASMKSKWPSLSAPIIRNDQGSGPSMIVFLPSPFLTPEHPNSFWITSLTGPSHLSL